MADPYQILGVARSADDATIKRAYRRLAKKLHPDLNPGDKAVENRFKEATAAYELLSDAEKRRQFDLGLIDFATLAPKLEAPRLTVMDVSMTSGDMFNQNFLVHLNVQNPNDRELPIKGIDYKLFLQGDSFAEGVSTAPFVVPALGEKEFDLTVRTNFVSSLGRLLTRLNGKKSVEYVIEGQVLLSSGMRQRVAARLAQ